jgi:hypothetical protein
LTGYWGDDLIWATVLVGVKTGYADVDCCNGVVCMGIPKIGWGACLWGRTGAFLSVGITICAWVGPILTLSKALRPWLK